MYDSIGVNFIGGHLFLPLLGTAIAIFLMGLLEKKVFPDDPFICGMTWMLGLFILSGAFATLGGIIIGVFVFAAGLIALVRIQSPRSREKS